jgi:hypothetical protein
MEDQAPAEEERPPYVVAMSSASEEGEAVRNVIVRMPLLDERVADLFRVEARQLPKDWPGLIMFDVSELPTVFQAWQPLIKRRFQPTLNTRVGAVCLFASGLFVQVSGAPSDSGVRVQQLTRSRILLPNPYAAIPIPSWVSKTLETLEDDPIRVVRDDQ